MRVEAILNLGRSSKFEHEATCRHALRVEFILIDGKSWALADYMAATVVRAALHAIGARRPSWYEAQPEYTRTRGAGCLYCANPECGRPIMRESHQVMRYCSEACRIEDKHRRHYAEHLADRVSYAQARRSRLRTEAQPRTCELCGQAFQPFDDGRTRQRFCGKICRSRYASQCAASWRPARIRGRNGQFIRPG